MEVYNAIVKGFEKNLSPPLEIDAFLESLQKSVKELRIAYRNKPVFVPYERIDIQSAYLTVYLPHYYQLIYKILLEEVPDIFDDKEEIRITFIGGGPGSEVYGALKYIFNNCHKVKDIHVTILDINASTWKYSHSIVRKDLIDGINKKNINIHWEAINYDLVSLEDTKQIDPIINKSDLLVVQNCLNEIATSHLSELRTNINTLFSSLPSTSYLLMSDLTSGARRTIKLLEDELVNNFEPKFLKTTLSLPCSRSLLSVHHRPIPIITLNLLNGTDGLIPRKNLKYDYSILSKGAVDKPIDYEALGFKALYRPLDFKYLDANDYIHKKTFVGIDFGTSSTVVSIARLIDGEIKITALPVRQKNERGIITKKPIVPSVISLVKGPRLIVGVHAADLKPYLEYGKNTWYSFKSYLNDLEGEVYQNSDLANNSSLKISNAREALNFFLYYLKTELFEYLNENGLSQEVEYSISIPAGFSSKEKYNLKACLLNVGIECEDTPFIEEPNAALINYLFEKNLYVEKDVPKNILVLDLGAGTVDVSILRAENSDEGFTSQLLSVYRLGKIGGDLIDKLIADSVIKNSDLLKPLGEQNMKELVSLCEKLKFNLCKYILTTSSENYRLPFKATSTEVVNIPPPIDLKAFGINVASLSFKEFNDIMLKYWNGFNNSKGVKDTIEVAISKAKLELSNIDKVIITGGGGRNPYMKSMVSNYFCESELIVSDNIQEQVSRGAALQSFILNSFGKNIVKPILGHDLYLKGINKSVLLFDSGISLPSVEVEIEIDEYLSISDKEIICFSSDNDEYRKQFVLPANLPVSKLIFYIAPDQELKCEIVGSNYEKEAQETYNPLKNTLIKIK